MTFGFLTPNRYQNKLPIVYKNKTIRHRDSNSHSKQPSPIISTTYFSDFLELLLLIIMNKSNKVFFLICLAIRKHSFTSTRLKCTSIYANIVAYHSQYSLSIDRPEILIICEDDAWKYHLSGQKLFGSTHTFSYQNAIWGSLSCKSMKKKPKISKICRAKFCRA